MAEQQEQDQLGVIRNYRFGLGGVDLVSDPLKLGGDPSDRATQLQNGELVPDQARGGQEVLSKRGGLAVLNGSALSGSVVGMIGWPLKTTFTRTVYAARQTETANTWATSTNGTSWTPISTPLQAALDAKYANEDDNRDARRMVSFRNLILYAGNGYTQNTDDPILVYWNGTEAVEVTKASFGPSTTPPWTIVDMLVANRTIYFAINEDGGTAPDIEGRVMSLDMDSGVVTQIATMFGAAADGKMPGGAPACLAFYKGQLWVGLNCGATTDGIGKVVRCYPEISETWTADVSNLSGGPVSMIAFQGALYVGTKSSAATAEKIYKRSATAGTYSAVFTGVGADGNASVSHFVLYDDDIYAVQYHATAPTIHIKKSDDGTTWTTDRDVDSSDSGVAGNLAGGGLAGPNSDLLYVFRSLTAGGADGFIMRKASGSWTKVSTANYLGPIATLVERS